MLSRRLRLEPPAPLQMRSQTDCDYTSLVTSFHIDSCIQKFTLLQYQRVKTTIVRRVDRLVFGATIDDENDDDNVESDFCGSGDGVSRIAASSKVCWWGCMNQTLVAAA